MGESFPFSRNSGKHRVQPLQLEVDQDAQKCTTLGAVILYRFQSTPSQDWVDRVVRQTHASPFDESTNRYWLENGNMGRT